MVRATCLPTEELSELDVKRATILEVAGQRITSFANDHENVSRSMVAYKLYRAGTIDQDIWRGFSSSFRQNWLQTHTEKSARAGMMTADRTTTSFAVTLHELAGAMPGATVEAGPKGNEVYQVSRRSFVFFRNPRPDAVDPETGERYDDVIVLWVGSEIDKQALVADETTPYFTTPHFDGHLSVLLARRGSAS